MQRLATLCLTLLLTLSSHLAQADSALSERKDVKDFITQMVKQHGFKKDELVAVINDAKLQPQIIESMEKPYEKKPWDIYKELFLTAERVQAGIDFWHQNAFALEKAEQQFGVPANIIVAIIGVETLYGKHQGNYRVLDALTTLAFNYPKRSVYFTKELAEFLILCREHRVPPSQYLGSYAGAMGKPQFMPSSYRHYATDFNPNSKIDLMNDDSAVIASVANYFNKHGWKMNQGIAQPAQIVGTGYKTINTTYKSANYQIKRLEKAGIKPLTAAMNVPAKAGLIELETQTGAQEFWLAYPNFYVITRYNSSPQYALAVYLLSQQLKSQWAKTTEIGKRYAYA